MSDSEYVGCHKCGRPTKTGEDMEILGKVRHHCRRCHNKLAELFNYLDRLRLLDETEKEYAIRL